MNAYARAYSRLITKCSGEGKLKRSTRITITLLLCALWNTVFSCSVPTYSRISRSNRILEQPLGGLEYGCDMVLNRRTEFAELLVDW